MAEVVEHQRLLSLTSTQRRHIEELRKQLQETLEVKQQQQLQLVEASPARKHVRKLLERAAADNTALAQRVEVMRAQRNALLVTKAALTAQVSELIRVAANSAQAQVEHRQLLLQLQQLATMVDPQLSTQPEEQLTAVAAYIKQAKCMQAELAALKGRTKQQQQPAAVPPPSSPTGLRLDQRATSQLIWTDSCPDLFAAAPQQQQQQQQQQRQEGVQEEGTPSFGAWAGGGVMSDAASTAPHAMRSTAAAAAAAAGRAGASAAGSSYQTAHSCLSELAPLSPLRGSSSNTAGVGGGSDGLTPCSRTPTADTAATAGGLAAGDGGSPLSAQSLSMFGSRQASPACLAAAAAAAAAARAPGRVALSPLRRCGLHTPGGAWSGTDPAGSSASLREVSVDSWLADGPGSHNRQQQQQQQQQQQPLTPGSAAGSSAATCGAAAASAALCSLSGCSSSRRAHSAAARTAPGTGLRLGDAFRLAAVDSLWPSPAAAALRGGALGLQAGPGAAAAADAAAGDGGGIRSHGLWLLELDAGDDEGDEEARPLDLGSWPLAGLAGVSPTGLRPRTLTDADFLEAGTAGGSAGGSADVAAAAGEGLSSDSSSSSDVGLPRRRTKAVRLCAAVVLATAVAAGGTAAWQSDPAAVLQLVARGTAVGQRAQRTLLRACSSLWHKRWHERVPHVEDLSANDEAAAVGLASSP